MRLDRWLSLRAGLVNYAALKLVSLYKNPFYSIAEEHALERYVFT